MSGANDGFGVDTAQLRKAAEDIYSCFTDVNSLVSNLVTQLEPLASQWRGAAGTAFHEVWTRWESDMRKIDAVLMDIGDKVSRSSGEYHRTEISQRENISKIMQALG